MGEKPPRTWGDPWTKLRGGLHRHFLEGKLDEATGFLFLRLLLMIPAEGFASTGVVWTSAADVSHRICPGWTLRKAQRVLSRLEETRYIRRWRQEGSRGTYPIQIHRWEVPFGDTQGEVINAWESDTYDRPAFFDVTRHDTPDDTPSVTPDDTPDGNTVLKDIDEAKEEERSDGASSLNGHGKEVLDIFDQVIRSQGLPTDRRTPKAKQRAIRAAERLLNHTGPQDPDIIRQAVMASMNDRFLRDQGFPFELWASKGSNYIRQAVIANGTRSADTAGGLGNLLSAVDEDLRHES